MTFCIVNEEIYKCVALLKTARAAVFLFLNFIFLCLLTYKLCWNNIIFLLRRVDKVSQIISGADKIFVKGKIIMVTVVLSRKRLLSLLCFCLVGILSFLTLNKTGAYAVFYGGNLRRLPIYSVGTDEKKVAISFDCAWGVDYTDKLLEIMREKQVCATFFMVEFWTEKYPEYVKKIDESGHEIGTHSATHPHMSKLSAEAIVKELTTSSEAITNITGKKVEVFRPPFGDYNDTLIETAENMGLFTIQWDVDSLDWKNLSADEITKRVTGKVKNGSIVLFHNNGLHTAEALPKIIDILQKQGYIFVRIGDLIYRNNYRIAVDGTQISNG